MEKNEAISERLDYVTLKVAKNEQDIMFLRYRQ